jgi:hypothetical protein
MLVDLPEDRVAWSDPRLRAGFGVLLLAAVIALTLLPRAVTNNDEFYYAGQAYTLAHGRLAPQAGDPLPVPEESPAQAFRYPVAWPAVLAIGRVFSFGAMYVVALLVHLLGAAAVARLLVRRGAPSWLVAAYVFHPVLWIYSRTLLSDVPATAALMIAMDAWENRGRTSAAGALGFSAGVRLANVTTVFGFGLATLKDVRRRSRDVVSLVLGAAAFWLVQMLVNHTLGGYWLVSTYAQQGAGMLNGGMALENLALYVAGLAFLPPFSLLVALARPRRVDRWAWLAAVVVAVYVPVSFHNVSPNLLETLVGGQRYVLPAHAALLVATARIWSTAPALRRAWLPVAAGVVVAIVGALAGQRLERRHRLAAMAVSACHPGTLGFNRYANRVAGSVDATRYQLTSDDAPTARQGWDVLVLAPGFQSHMPGFSSDWPIPPPRIPGGDCRRVGPYAIYDFTGRCPPQGEPCTVAAAATPTAR